MRKLTHLGRVVSLQHPTHRILLGLSALAAALALLYPAGRQPGTAMWETAATVLLAWTLLREIDPDRPRLSLAGAALAGAVTIMTGETSLVALGMTMLAARIVVRSTGREPLLTDVGAVGVAAGVLARNPLGWSAGLAVAAAIALDTMLERPAARMHAWLALAVGAAVTITAVLTGALPRAWNPPDWITLALMTAVVLLALRSSRSVPISTDDRGVPLVGDRLLVARWLVVAALLLGTLVGGSPATGVWPALLTTLVALTPTRS